MFSVAQAFDQALQHHQSRRLGQAEQLYRQILQVSPGHVEALHLLGVVVHQSGKSHLAIDYIQEALRHNPSCAEAHNSLGLILKELKKPAEAAASYQEALRLKPDFAGAHNNLGLVLIQQGKLADAMASYKQALLYQPDYVEALNNLGCVLQEQGKMEEAVAKFEQALRLRPDYAAAHNNCGLAHKVKGNLREAETSLREAVRLKPGYAEAHNNLGLALRELGRLDEAVSNWQEALRLKADYAEPCNNLALAYLDQGRPADALASLEAALQIEPDYVKAHWNRALMWLLQGDLERGWAEYEWRWRRPEHPPRTFPQPLWQGDPLAGRTILLHAEQGLGDTLQFIRYAPLVKAQGGTVLLECQPALVRLLSRCPWLDRVMVQGERTTHFDVHAPLLSLPWLFGTTSVDRIPAAAAYLDVDADLVRYWRKRLKSVSGFRVGITWQGNPVHGGDRRRSVPLTRFAPLGAVAGVNLVSLQKGAGSEQLATMPGVAEDLGAELTDMADTAAVLQSLNLVVTVDTALAHLAGARGTPAWVALPYPPDWRWLMDRPDSPWYPSLRLFRQQRFQEWDDVFARIEAALRDRLLAPGGEETEAKRHQDITKSNTSDPMAVVQMFTMAGKHYQAGDRQRAEQLCRQILEIDPEEVEALHLLSVITHESGNTKLAVDYTRQVLRLHPNYAEAHHNLGVLLQKQQGKEEEAVASYKQALRLRPKNAESHNNLAVLLQRRGDAEAALACYQHALRLRPNYAEAHNNLGVLLHDQGKLEEAVASYHRALHFKPDYAEAHTNLGNVYQEQGKAEEAAACCRQALRLKPDYAEAHNILGNACSDLGNLAQALDHYERALSLKPDFAQAQHNLALALVEWGRLDEAAATLEPAMVPIRAGSIPVNISAGELSDKIAFLEVQCQRSSGREEIGRANDELTILKNARARFVPNSEQLAGLAAQLKAVHEALWQVEAAIHRCEQNGETHINELTTAFYEQHRRRNALQRQIDGLSGENGAAQDHRSASS